MLRPLPVVGAAALAAAFVLSLSAIPRAEAAPDGGADAGPALPACVEVRTESRYVPYGYNHLVTVRNGCTKLAVCSVATDVTPEAQTVEIAPASSTTVSTYLSAASQAFVAKVRCTLR